MSTVDLSEREHTLLTALVTAWEASTPGPAHESFVLDSVRPFAHPNWPGGVPAPRREEVRRLGQLGWLARDERAPRGTWCHYPTVAARQAFGGSDPHAEALADPDRRLGVILEAIVTTFRADASVPLHFAGMDQADYVEHPHWPLQPDAVHAHDITQLEHLGLVDTQPRGADFAFWPTQLANTALSDPVGFPRAARSRHRRRAGTLADPHAHRPCRGELRRERCCGHRERRGHPRAHGRLTPDARV